MIQPIGHLGVFAKYWEPGQVKTRLSAGIGPQQASSLYQVFLKTTLERFANVADLRTLAFAPSDRESEFRHLTGDGWEIQPQRGDEKLANDLGVRMWNFFDSCFETGATQVVLIGSDSPSLPIDYVKQAFQYLDCNDAVLGPATDGGYYLVGLSKKLPELFHGIDWSTDHVLEQSVARLKAGGNLFETLQPWEDVDELEDLQRLKANLEADSATNADASLQVLLEKTRQSLAELQR